LIDGFHEAWDGDLLVSTLTTHKLMRIRIAEDRVVFAEDIKLGQGRRIRYVLQHSDGTIAILTDDRQVIFFSPVENGMAGEFASRFIENEMDADTTLKQSVKTALQQCAQCHGLDRGNNATSPALGEVFGAHVGSTTFDGYSDALVNARGDIWTRERLEAFLDDPDGVYPGTFMPDPQLKNPEVRNAIIDVLQALSPLQKEP
jgi:cytochrome c2